MHGRLCYCGGTVATSYRDRKSTRLNSSHTVISYAVFCLKKKRKMGLAVLNCDRFAARGTTELASSRYGPAVENNPRLTQIAVGGCGCWRFVTATWFSPLA